MISRINIIVTRYIYTETTYNNNRSPIVAINRHIFRSVNISIYSHVSGNLGESVGQNHENLFIQLIFTFYKYIGNTYSHELP